MKARIYTAADRERWESFVASSRTASLYHRIHWKDVLEKSFGHGSHYLLAEDHGEIKGVLPLVHLKSLYFGSFMVSMPYFNYGGICAENADAVSVLMNEAVSIASKQGASHIELRHMENLLGLPVKTSKVSMFLELPASNEALWKSFSSKLKSQIRRPEKEGMTARVGRAEELESFYDVFSRNMRDLGTPVYSKKFFSNILEAFPESTWICTVYHRGVPAASGFLAGFKDRLEIPWASSLKSCNHMSPNMLLYWSVLKFACERGFRVFDFGRCTPGEGTYKFKEQWGARPASHYWHYWLRKGGEMPEVNPHNPKYRAAISVWKRLPLSVTKFLGPALVKNIP